MEHFTSLGTTAVLDPENLSVGSHIEIDGQVLVVDRIVNDLHVYFRPVSGWSLLKFRWSQFSPTKKGIAMALVLSITVVLLWGLYSLLF